MPLVGVDRGHAVEINGVELCTLGHSFTINDSDSLFGWGWVPHLIRTENLRLTQRRSLPLGLGHMSDLERKFEVRMSR